MNQALLSSKDMNWCTPQDFFDTLNQEFHFILDAAITDNLHRDRDGNAVD